MAKTAVIVDNVVGNVADATLELRSAKADGASAIGIKLSVAADITNASASLLSVGDNASVSYSEKMYLNKDGQGWFAGGINANTQKVANVATPSVSSDAATMGSVDSVASGLDVKASCRVASTANIDVDTGGLLTIDGKPLVAGD